MQHLKSLFISAYLGALAGALAWAAWHLIETPSSLGHWGVALASGAPLGFFVRLFLSPVARTSARLPAIPVVGLAGTALSLFADGIGLTAGLAAFNGVLLTLAYTHWYSDLGARDQPALAVGQTMPDLSLRDVGDRPVSTPELTRQTALWIFYRGNWCPLCMAQIQEVAADYQRLAARGVAVHLISPQAPSHTRELAERFAAPMNFLRDADNLAARRLGILAEGGLPTGLQALGYDSDVPLPTVLITAPGGRIVYSDLTTNYRIRPEPAAFIEALDRAGL